MRVLIYGAGVLGSHLAHALSKKHDVTVLARNRRYDCIKKNGLVIKHKFGKTTTDKVNVINELEINDIYDAIFVVLRYSQLDTIIPILSRNKTQNIIFVGNNMNAEKYQYLENKTILFGFFSAAGKKCDDYIESICLNKITIGRCDGRDDSNDLIHEIFNDTKIKVTIENKMNDWLKSHGCAVLPLVFACYKVNGNLKLLKNEKQYSLKIMDAIIEGYDVLQALNYQILPSGEYDNCVNKKNICAWLYRFMFSNFIGKVCISDHAMSARDEFLEMDESFLGLANKTNIDISTYVSLRKDFIN